MFSATTALSFQVQAKVQVGIDVNTSGNSATTVGSEEACLSVNVGDTFDIDVWIRGVQQVQLTPDFIALGLGGYSYNFHFDPNMVQVTKAQNNFMTQASAPFERIAANYVPNADANPLPATTGNTRIDFFDFSEAYETGDGVLSRLTLQAVGAGTTTLRLDSELEGEPSPAVWMEGGFPYTISQLQDAVINVGTPCDAASIPTPFDPKDTWAENYGLTTTPTPTPGPPTPTPTLGPSDVPEGDTKVSVDAISTANSATVVAQIDDCASADIGEKFSVDIVIEDVENLLGWEAPVSYDPAILKIVDRNVKLFQAANSGSQVFDASNQTPNTTGFYRAASVDQADPAALDSGDGVLIRLTMEAIGKGTSKVSISPVDLNQDGQAETGVLLKNGETQAIGGPIFRGPTRDAEIRVGTECSGSGRVVPTSAPSSNGDNGIVEPDGNDSSDTWILVAAGAVVAVLAVGGAAALLIRRRKGGGTPA